MESKTEDRNRQIRERIRANFDRAARDYAAFEAQRAYFRRLLDALLAVAPPLAGKRVLDVGCGTGASLERLAEAAGPGGCAVGLDVSLGMLREARRRQADAALVLLDGCRFAGGFKGRFDAVVYNAVIFMLPDARGSLESAREVLADGGLVLLTSLEGAYLQPEGRPVPSLIAERGHKAGRHALSEWPELLATVSELFGRPETDRLALALSPREFLSFYGMEPMSAGLLPSLPYPERRRVLEDLCAEWEAGGQRLEQVWNLAWAKRQEKRP